MRGVIRVAWARSLANGDKSNQQTANGKQGAMSSKGEASGRQKQQTGGRRDTREGLGPSSPSPGPWAQVPVYAPKTRLYTMTREAAIARGLSSWEEAPVRAPEPPPPRTASTLRGAVMKFTSAGFLKRVVSRRAL